MTELELMNRNIRAHKNLTRLDFPHTTINSIVLDKVRLWFQQKSMNKLTKFRLLDLGCGTGYFLSRALKQGWDAWGVDPYPRGAATRLPLKKRVITGTIECIVSSRFDCVTAVEVLEHVNDYLRLIHSMMKVLRPGGLLITTVPNDWQFRAARGPNGDVEPMYGHLWRFDLVSLKSDLENFSNEVRVESIYSRTLDSRPFRIARIFPSKVFARFSEKLVSHSHNGAWLLGMVEKQHLNPTSDGVVKTLTPSARHYTDCEMFQGQ